MVGPGRQAIEVAKTAMEVAEVAWSAIEHRHNHNNHPEPAGHRVDEIDRELEALRSENLRLKALLRQNLILLQDLSQSPPLSKDCPPHLHAHLLETVGSTKFLDKLKSLHEEHAGNALSFPFKEAIGTDLQSAEILINVDQQEPSWWVWVTDEMVPSSIEERSEIDDESYMIISEEHIVDGVANFMARCILSNPKAQSISPEELQSVLSDALGTMNNFDKMFHIWNAGKMFYTLATWGMTFAGLYNSRHVLKFAAKGIHYTGKLAMKVL